MAFSKRGRLKQRPAEDVNAFTGHTRAKQGEQFLLAPLVQPERTPKSVRDPKLGSLRADLKDAEAPGHLIQCLADARESGEVDASILTSAMQRCGYSLWWQALLEVRGMQLGQGVRLDAIGCQVFMHALALCLKEWRVPKHAISRRKKQALELGKEVWSEVPRPLDAFQLGLVLSSAWNLCAAVGGEEAVEWASGLEEWSRSESVKYQIMQFTPLLSLYEASGQTKRVDQLIHQVVHAHGLALNAVLLGSLINAAGMLYCSERGDYLWHLFTQEHDVRPNEICYVAHAKAHILSGHPASATKIIEEMYRTGVGRESRHAVVAYVQALLIVCHSTPTQGNLLKLKEYMRKWGRVEISEAGQQMQAQWKGLREQVYKLLRQSHPLKLADLLVYHNAKNGRMKDWPNYEAGTMYLCTANPPPKRLRPAKQGRQHRDR